MLASKEVLVSSFSRSVDEAFRLLNRLLKEGNQVENICDNALDLHRLHKNDELVFELVDERENIRKFSLQDFISYLCQLNKLPFSKIERISSDSGNGSIQTITLR